jgi:beta-N-acetylhexosaminidase
MAVRSVIFGCSGLRLGAEEKRFFAEAQPLGFILFARNVETPAQVRALVADLRASVGRADAPVLIDQEGGRVQRLRPPRWREAPPAARFAELMRRKPESAIEAVRLNARLMAAELADLGITVDCAPVLDVPQPGAHSVIGDRALGDAPGPVATLGRAMCEGLLAGGVLPMIKHIPGHGRPTVDSHLDVPIVEASLKDLMAVDFAPFKALNDMPWAMTAHVVYTALDRDRPATISPQVVAEAIRGMIDFRGVLLSDDIGMSALKGSFAERAAAALKAGCDVALHCSGEAAGMTEAVAGAGFLSAAAERRLARAEAMRRKPESFDRRAAAARVETLLAES